MAKVFFTNIKIIKYQSLDMNLFKLNESNCGLKICLQGMDYSEKVKER
jgi:hypothetical protein